MASTQRIAGQGMIASSQFVDDNGDLMPVSFRFLNSLFNRQRDPETVASLPDPTKNKGIRGFVTDATVNAFGAPIAGGGAIAVPVYCDGTAWRVG